MRGDLSTLSDLDWTETIDRWPSIQFYDYTKITRIAYNTCGHRHRRHVDDSRPGDVWPAHQKERQVLLANENESSQAEDGKVCDFLSATLLCWPAYNAPGLIATAGAELYGTHNCR